ncbi:MAG: galactose-1-phosphate uridylyltransferase [Pirellulaceae bacterium]
MSEFRRDFLSGSWVIIAEHRAGRPDDFRRSSHRRVVAPCPFCQGNECETPGAVACYPDPVASSSPTSWQVRVVPNKFPAVLFEDSGRVEAPGPHENHDGGGAHEVVIESPRHIVSVAELTDAQIEYTFAAYQDRLRYWRSDKRLAYGLVFKNARAAGGASLEHTHSQLIATPMVPDIVAGEVARCEAYRRREAKCPLCDLLAYELAAGQRIVEVTDHLAAYCPYASRFPFEMLIMPRKHSGPYEEVDADVRNELAHLVRRLVARLESLLPEPAYNFWIHTAPWSHDQNHEAFHWHVHLAPRLTRLAGFELGAGYYINPVSSEEAANRLQAV